MATNIYQGRARRVAQVNTETPANVEVGDVFTLKLENSAGDVYTISFTATAATVANVTAGLHAAAAAAKTAGYAPWNEVTTTDDTTHVTITADTAGTPFYVTAAAVDGGVADTQTLTDASSTAVDGPGHWSSVLNWSTGAAPAAGDDVIIPADATGTMYGVDATGNALNSFTVEAGCAMNGGSASRFLQIDVGNAAPKEVAFAGTGTWFLDVDNADEINVTHCGSGGGSGSWPLNIKGLDNVELNFTPDSTACTMAFASLAGDGAAECTTFNVSGGTIEIGPSVTQVNGADAPDINQTGGTITMGSAAGTVKRSGSGSNYTQTEGNIEALHDWSDGGTSYLDCNDTVTAANIGPDARVSAENNTRGVTIATLTVYGSGELHDPNNAVTISNPIVFKQTGDGPARIQTGDLASV